jgi:hypothetical protein
MTTLAEILKTHHAALLPECVKLIEQTVSNKSGFKGMGLKAALAAGKAAKPDLLPKAVNNLLPEFGVALEPLYQQFKASHGNDFSAFLSQHKQTATAALLAVADARIARNDNGTVKSLYSKLRGSAEDEVQAVVPALGQLMGRFF